MNRNILKIGNRNITGIVTLLLFLIITSLNAVADGNTLEPENGIPLVIVRVDESETSIADMNNSYDHSIRCTKATVEIKVPENYNGGYAISGLTTQSSTGELTLDYIRGRGNSTWQNNKKPYKIQLKKARDLFGMGASKDWALLANSYDKTVMKNRITSWLGEEMGLAFTPRFIPVDLVMVGSVSGVHSYGTYCLSGTIKVEESRVDIDKLKKNDIENITGGYLISRYTNLQDADKPDSTKFTTNYGLDYMNDTPEFDETASALTNAQILQRNYSRKYMQEVEDLIVMPDEIDERQHEEIAKRLDLTSTVDYWLLQELSFNTDGFGTSSTFIYKVRDGKLFFGPLWDFDLAWGNVVWSPLNETFNNLIEPWIDNLRHKDPLFVKLIKERFELFDKKLTELTKEGGIIDQFKAEVENSVAADYNIWSNSTGGTYRGIDDYDGAVEGMRTWIINRHNWAKNNIDNVGVVFHQVSYEVDGVTMATELVRHNEKSRYNPDVKAPEGKVFNTWKEKESERVIKNYQVRRDVTFIPDFIEVADAIEPNSLFIDDYYNTVSINKGLFDLYDITEVTPYDSTNTRVTWSSSNEGVGVIDPVNHRVILKGIGDTTITGTLYNNITSSFTLHVIESDAPFPIIIDARKIQLSNDNFIYNGSVQKPNILSIDGMELIEGEDFTTTFSNDSSKDVGQYTVTVRGKGNYAGTTSETYKISTAKIEIPRGESFTYDGELKTGVASSEDYIVTGNTGIDAGDYKATLKLKDKNNLNWSDGTTTDKEVEWKINKASNTLAIQPKTATIRYNRLKKRKIVLSITKVIRFLGAGEGTITYTKLSGRKKISINKKTGNVTIRKGLKKGLYRVRVKVVASGDNNFKPSLALSKIIKIRVK